MSAARLAGDVAAALGYLLAGFVFARILLG